MTALAALGQTSARVYRRQAQQAEQAGRLSEAVLLYNQAAARGSVESLMRARQLTSQIVAASQAAAPAPKPEVKPEVDLSEFDALTASDLREARELLPPPELLFPPNTFNLDYRDDPRKLWTTVAGLLGLSIQFDEDYPPGGQPVRFRTDGQSARQVLSGVSAATGSFVVTQGPKQILVVKDTTQKRQEREPNVAVLLNLPDPTTPQELQEAARVVQQVMEIQKFAIDNSHRMVMMRDRISKVRPAQHLFEQLLGARPAVMIDVELFEVRNAAERTLGIGLPTSATIYWLNSKLSNTSTSLPDAPYLVFGGGNTMIGVTLGDASVTATALKTYGRSRHQAFVQSVHGQPAQLLLGERYPLVTAGFFGAVSPTDTNTYRPPPTFQFENLGLTLKVTPFVHDEDEMSIEIDAEFKLLTGAEINGLPILANRKFTSRVRLRNGQWAVMAGLDSNINTYNRSGIPGLINIPYIGRIFTTETTTVDEGGALVLIKPRLLGIPAGSLDTREIFLGPEGRPAMPL